MDLCKTGSIPNRSSLEWSWDEKTILTQHTRALIDSGLGGRSVTWTAHWTAVSTLLEQYGYTRTPYACRAFWDRNVKMKSANTQAVEPIWGDGQQVPDSSLTAARSSPISASSRLNAPYSNKRAAIHPDTDRSQDREASSSIDDSENGRTKRFKGVRVTDMLRQGSLEYQSPYQASRHSSLPPEVLSDGPRPSLELSPTDSAFCCTTNGMRRMSKDRIVEGAGCPPDPMSRTGSQCSSTEEPTSDLVPSTAVGSQQTLLTAIDGFQSITVDVGDSITDQQNCSSHLSSSTNSLSGETNSTAIHPVISPVETASIPTASEGEQQIACASRQVENFEAEIQKLKRNATTRTMIVTSIGQEIEHSQKEYDELLQGKQEEIDRVLRELEEQHSKKFEALKSKLQNLKESKQTVLGELKRNALEVSRKETGVTRFQAIIDYYNPEEHRANLYADDGGSLVNTAEVSRHTSWCRAPT